jgi:hypothetical protein
MSKAGQVWSSWPSNPAENQASEAAQGPGRARLLRTVATPVEGAASTSHRIGESLKGLTAQAWVTTAFLITSTICVPVYGKNLVASGLSESCW